MKLNYQFNSFQSLCNNIRFYKVKIIFGKVPCKNVYITFKLITSGGELEDNLLSVLAWLLFVVGKKRSNKWTEGTQY